MFTFHVKSVFFSSKDKFEGFFDNINKLIAYIGMCACAYIDMCLYEYIMHV